MPKLFTLFTIHGPTLRGSKLFAMAKGKGEDKGQGDRCPTDVDQEVAGKDMGQGKDKGKGKDKAHVVTMGEGKDKGVVFTPVERDRHGCEQRTRRVRLWRNGKVVHIELPEDAETSDEDNAVWLSNLARYNRT